MWYIRSFVFQTSLDCYVIEPFEWTVNYGFCVFNVQSTQVFIFVEALNSQNEFAEDDFSVLDAMWSLLLAIILIEYNQ